MQINHSGRWLGKTEDVHALTDITGFGLAGHLVEMAQGAGVTLRIHSDSVPIIELAEQLALEGLFPGGAYRNMESYTDQLSFNENWDLDRQLLFTDPQTNGGLLIAAGPGVTETVLARLHEDGFPEATVIGEVEERNSGNREVEFI
jgi:selenide,water dikinase